MSWTMPLKKYKLGTLFGVKDALHPNGHRGTDYNGFAAGTELYAVADGKVVINEWSDGLGWVVVLEVQVDGKPKSFGYCHLVEQSPHNVGHPMKMGEVIGKAGTSGKFSSGVHLHLTLSDTRKGVFAGVVQDAHKYLEAKIKASKAGN